MDGFPPYAARSINKPKTCVPAALVPAAITSSPNKPPAAPVTIPVKVLLATSTASPPRARDSTRPVRPAAAAPPKGPGATIDPTSPAIALAVVTAALSPGGTIVSYGILESQFIHLNAVILLMKNLSVHGFYTGFWYQKTHPEKQHSLFKKFIELVTQDRLKVPIEKTYSLRSYKEALTHANKSGRKGKIVFTGPGYEST